MNRNELLQTIEMMPNGKIKTLTKFGMGMEEKLGGGFEMTFCPLADFQVSRINPKTGYGKVKTKEAYAIEFNSPLFRLKFCELSENEVELFWIETYSVGGGLGTQLMNQILDVADEMNIRIKAIPVPIRSNEINDGKCYLTRLRQWYQSFGFRSNVFDKVAMTYNPAI